MRAKMLVLALLGILALIAPAAAEARAKAASNDGKVTVDVKVNRFAVAGRKIAVHMPVWKGEHEGAPAMPATDRPSPNALSALGACVCTTSLQARL